MANQQISKLLNDEAILAELGARLTRRRLDLGLTQAQLAEQAGVSKRTVERVEAGESAQMSSLVRILRVLELLAGLDGLVTVGGPRPMELLKLGKRRQRASPSQQADDDGTPWSWDDKI